MTLTLAELLPADREGLFLRACVHEGPGGIDAWERWLDRATRDGASVRRAMSRVNTLLPLLAWNLRRNHATLDARLETHLRSAQLTEELRWQRYRTICAGLFRELGKANLPFIALDGAAVAETTYPSPALRHSDGVALLLREQDLDRATDWLLAAGCRHGTADVLPSPIRRPPLVQADGVSVWLERRLLVPYYTLPYDRLWHRSRMTSVAGVQVRVLGEEDSLIALCARGMSRAADLRWVADAWFLLQNNPRIDWRMFTETVTIAKLELLVYGALGYLAETIGAPVPAEVLDRLEAGARRTGFVGKSAARPWPVEMTETDRARRVGWWTLVSALWRQAFPPPVQFAVHYDVPLWAVPFWYFYRMGRYAWWRYGR